MKEKHYYIPSIEEFYVGFTYEELLDDNDLLYTWEEVTIEQVCELEFISDDLEHRNGNNIRVKYLDKEDIESLGFKTDVKNEYIFAQYGEEEFYLDYEITSHYIKISSLEDDFFRGYVNNKSELKKLLKQIKKDQL